MARPLVQPKKSGRSDAVRRDISFNSGEANMGDQGSKDKDKREKQKKAKLTAKEKRKLKQDKKNK